MKSLEELLEERIRLLAEHPELRPMQKEIDRILQTAGEDPAARAQALFSTLIEHLGEEFVPAIGELAAIKEKTNKLKKTGS